jgi:hypothetical protein
MLSVIMLNVVMLNVVMLSVAFICYVERHNAECCHAVCHYSGTVRTVFF